MLAVSSQSNAADVSSSADLEQEIVEKENQLAELKARLQVGSERRSGARDSSYKTCPHPTAERRLYRSGPLHRSIAARCFGRRGGAAAPSLCEPCQRPRTTIDVYCPVYHFEDQWGGVLAASAQKNKFGSHPQAGVDRYGAPDRLAERSLGSRIVDAAAAAAAAACGRFVLRSSTGSRLGTPMRRPFDCCLR